MVDSLQLIMEERRRQDKKWGEQNHSDLYWLGILTEELGELAKAIIENKPTNFDYGEVNRELTQVAAVALAWMEAKARLEASCS